MKPAPERPNIELAEQWLVEDQNVQARLHWGIRFVRDQLDGSGLIHLQLVAAGLSAIARERYVELYYPEDVAYRVVEVA